MHWVSAVLCCQLCMQLSKVGPGLRDVELLDLNVCICKIQLEPYAQMT